MIRLQAALLLLLYVGTLTELPQVLKLPVLVCHYLEHASQQPLSLGEFFHEHYFMGDVHDADRQRDLQLPFKVALAGAWSVILMLTPPLSVAACEFITPAAISRLRDCSQILSGIKRSIWHPPTC